MSTSTTCIRSHVYENKDLLYLYKKHIRFYGFKAGWCYELSYGEVIGTENGNAIYQSANSEYFAESDLDTAIRAFDERLASGGFKATNLSKPIAEIFEKEESE